MMICTGGIAREGQLSKGCCVYKHLLVGDLMERSAYSKLLIKKRRELIWKLYKKSLRDVCDI